MKKRYLVSLLIILTFSISIAIFCVQQVVYYFTQKTTVVGAWDEQGTKEYGSLAEITENNTLQPAVLGVRTQVSLFPEALVRSYQGFILDKYFAMEGSPLFGYGDEFVKACKKYNT